MQARGRARPPPAHKIKEDVMATTLTLAPTPGNPKVYSYKPDYGSSLDMPITSADLNNERAALMAMLEAPGQSPYTPELTEGAVSSLRRRFGDANATARAGFQSDLMARGGTGSSTELMGLSSLYNEGIQNEEDAVTQFMLGIADRSAEERRFRVGTGMDFYKTGVGQLENTLGRQFSRGSAVEGYGYQSNENALARSFEAEQDRIARAHEERLARQYMAQLAAQQAAARKAAKKDGKIGAITSLVGAGIGSFGGPAGAQVGASIGSQLPFLFS
jgi:hypothetical protein